MSAYIFTAGADAEQGTKPSQVPANLSLGLHIPWAGQIWQTLVCVLCIHVSCVTELTEVPHVQRLFQKGDPDPWNSAGVTEDFPHVMCLL